MECYLLIIMSSLFSKHVSLHTKNNTIVHISGVFRNSYGEGPENLKAFFFGFSIFQGGGEAQKIADKMIYPTKKVAKYR